MADQKNWPEKKFSPSRLVGLMRDSEIIHQNEFRYRSEGQI